MAAAAKGAAYWSALVADPARARRFGRAGRARVLDMFSWAAVAERTVELYGRLLA